MQYLVSRIEQNLLFSEDCTMIWYTLYQSFKSNNEIEKNVETPKLMNLISEIFISHLNNRY